MKRTLNEHLNTVLEDKYTGIPCVDDFNDEYKIVLYDTNNRIPQALSNIAFGLSLKLIRDGEEFDFLDNMGTKDQENAIKYIVSGVIGNGSQSVANALNSSGISWTSWKPRPDNKATAHVTCKDRNGNSYELVVYKK
jgi:hypothetical protein